MSDSSVVIRRARLEKTCPQKAVVNGYVGLTLSFFAHEWVMAEQSELLTY